MNQEAPSLHSIPRLYTLYKEDIENLNFIQEHTNAKGYSDIIRKAIALEARRIRAKITRDNKPN